MVEFLNSSRNLLKNKSLFKIAYIITTFFFSVHFVQYASYISIVLMIIWGIYLLAKDIAAKNIKNVYLWQCSAAFVAIGIISHVINIIVGDSNILRTIVGLVLLLITSQFMFLFVPNKAESVKTLKTEFYFIAKALVRFTTLCNVIGLIVLFIFKDTLGERIIIYDNRFTGAYINPNMGAFNCFLCIAFGLVLARGSFCKSIDKKPLGLYEYIPSAVLAYFVLIITDSKGALLALTVFLGIATLVILYRAIVDEFKKNLFKLCSVVILLCVTPFMSNVCSPIMTYAVSHSKIEVKTESKTSDKSVSEKTDDNSDLKTDKKKNEITFEHESGKSDGSGRIGLYKKCLEFFSEKPVFGWGCGNMLFKGDETQHNTIDNVKINLGTKIFEAHNGYLTVLSTSGIVGFLSFAVFGLSALFALFKNTLFTVRIKGIGTTAILFCITIAFCVYAFVEPSLVYYPTIVVSTLWLVIGIGLKLFEGNKGNIKSMSKLLNKMFS